MALDCFMMVMIQSEKKKQISVYRPLVYWAELKQLGHHCFIPSQQVGVKPSPKSVLPYHSWEWKSGHDEISQNLDMMKSSNGNIFRVTGPLCREFTGHGWIPLTKASTAELWCFLLSAPEQMVEQTIETTVIRDDVVLITSLWWILPGDKHFK